MNYDQLKSLDEEQKKTISSMFVGILSNIRSISTKKVLSLITDIPNICRLNHISYQYTESRKRTYNNMHPVVPTKGEIYNAYITEGVGKELSGNHLVVVIQSVSANVYSDKVNVVPIEGNGNKIKTSYQLQLTNEDLETGHLDKNPSRIIFSDILTIDKARLAGKIGKLKDEKLQTLNKKIRKQLNL